MPSRDTPLGEGSTLLRVATAGGRILGAAIALAGLALAAGSVPAGNLVWAGVGVAMVLLGCASVVYPLSTWELLYNAVWLLD